MPSAIEEIREKRANLITQAGELLDGAGEEGTLTEESQARFDEMMEDADKLLKKAENIERHNDAQKSLENRKYERAGREDITPGEAEQRGEVESSAFRNWAAGGIGNLTDDEREYMHNRQRNLSAEQRALTTGTGSAGGFLIPEGFHNQLEVAMKAFGGMRTVATSMRTVTGNEIPMPTANDTGNKGAILGENSPVGEQDVDFSSIALNAYIYSSKMVKVPLTLLQDSAFSLESYLADALGKRVARITNEHFTVGDGSSKPNGIVTAATLGKTGATGQTSAITYSDLVDLEHSVDPEYRPNARFMMHDNTIATIKKLKDGEGRPLWVPGVAEREPDRLMGYRYTVNQDMPMMAADAKSLLFGDLSKYIIRDAHDVMIMRLAERYAEYFQVAFLTFSRHDGDLLDAGANPVKFYKNAAS
ncbi:phage major capsid protein [Magnetococcus sp. PR-3]|uniref:phage major capsid protein n=1 Tax=Magnetococcus sp. PR-3 TaxID=3120355 RepID=UPI002FCDF22F